MFILFKGFDGDGGEKKEEMGKSGEGTLMITNYNKFATTVA